jgi:hypothetical protein
MERAMSHFPLNEKIVLSSLPFFLFAVLLGTGCAEDGMLGAVGDGTDIAGVVEGWTEGQGYRLSATLLTDPPLSAALSTGTVDASGSFRIALPAGGLVEPHINDALQPTGGFGDCSARPDIRPADLKVAYLELSAQKPGSPDIALVLTNNAQALSNPMPSDLGATYVYANRDGSITGKSSCDTGGQLNTTSYDLLLRAGWNTIVGSESRVRTGAVPAGVTWQKRENP